MGGVSEFHRIIYTLLLHLVEILLSHPIGVREPYHDNTQWALRQQTFCEFFQHGLLRPHCNATFRDDALNDTIRPTVPVLLQVALVLYLTIIMPYFPRPDLERVTQDVDEIYLLAAEALQRSLTGDERRHAFKQALLRAYQAGSDAQRDILKSYDHTRPTPLPQAMPIDPNKLDPGTLPPGPRPRIATPAPRPPTVPFGIDMPFKVVPPNGKG